MCLVGFGFQVHSSFSRIEPSKRVLQIATCSVSKFCDHVKIATYYSVLGTSNVVAMFSMFGFFILSELVVYL